MRKELINKHLDLAYRIAELNTKSRFRFGCVALNKKGHIVSISINNEKTHPYQYKLAKRRGNPHAQHLHAEIAALLKAREQVFTLIVVRLLKDGSLGYSKPCPICQDAIRLAGVREVVYINKRGTVCYG